MHLALRSPVAVTVAAIVFFLGFAAEEGDASVVNDTGYAMRISGSGDHLRIPNSASLNLITAITIEAWCLFDGAESTPGIEIVKRGDSNNGYVLSLVPLGFADERLNGGAFGVHSNTLEPPPATGSQWHHIAWSFDGSHSTLFFDGAPVQELAFSGSIGSTTSDLYFGIGIEGDGSWNLGTAEAWYDEIRIWNCGRTAVEIAGIYSGSLQGDELGLVGYWNFNSADGADLTAYGNDGIASAGVEFLPVPEPTTLSLLAFGLGAVAIRSRRKNV